MITLNALKREDFGKALKGAREAGKLPVIVYGAKEEATPFFVDAREFQKVFAKAGESTVVTLHTDAGEKDILIKEVAFHPVSGAALHADLYAIEKGKAVTVSVPLEFEGVAPAEKLGGNLVKVLHELEIEAMPKDLPHHIIVDVSQLGTLDSQILVKDLPIPKGVTVNVGEDEVVAAISVAGEEVKEEEAPIDLESIEVDKKGKKEEEDIPAGE